MEAGKKIRVMDEEFKEEATQKARKMISLAVQRYAADYVAEHVVSAVPLPSEEMKGRIIGREGRNIRAFEAATGIDVIIDDTPEAVILSGFNPVRREIARISLTRLVQDGRIHPARIEETVEKVTKEVEETIREAGEQALFDLGIHGVHAELVKLIGRLKYRTSYGQNIYTHSLEVAFLCGMIASELGLNAKVAKRAGLLHDIGKAVDHEVEGPHALIGADLARKYGESAKIVHAIGAHHEDESPKDILPILVQAADALSGARPGARREMLANYLKRLEDLEAIAKSFAGVEKSYAIQAGREIRIIVDYQKIGDDAATILARDIAKKIETDLSYPGPDPRDRDPGDARRGLRAVGPGRRIMWVLFLGDVVGRPGRKAAAEFLSRLRGVRDVDLAIANGENTAGGMGLTEPSSASCSTRASTS